jgi:hypothetical protein
MSDGGIGFSSDTMYVHFTSSSRTLLSFFEREIRQFSERKLHLQIKPRGITLRVFDIALVKELLKISPSYRTRPCNHFPICPFLKEETNPRLGKHAHLKHDDMVFAKIAVPEDLFESEQDKAQFLKIYASCDGYASMFPRRNSWSPVERMVGIVSHHPILRRRLHELLLDLGIPHNVKPYSLEMRSKESISLFSQKIGFIEGVKMTKNSKYWQGIDKNEVLERILDSFREPK